MRTFFCLPIDPMLRESLTQLSVRLQRSLRVRASWVKPENFHVTVRFLGEIEPMLTVELECRCRTVTQDLSPFHLHVDRIGAFPSISRARVLWAGGEACSDFLQLTSSLDAELQEIGFEKDRKPTVSHITLARIKGGGGASIEEAVGTLADWADYALRVDRLVLMESRLSTRGPTYYPLFTLPFGGGQDVTV